MFVAFVMAFSFIATPQAFAETEGTDEVSEVVVKEAPGFLVQIPAEARSSFQFVGVTATAAGDWLYITPMEGKESEASLLRETLNSKGVKTYPNRMVVMPPEKSLRSNLMEEILNESVELTGFDGTPFMHSQWYNSMLGLDGKSTLPLYYRAEKPMACVVDTAVDIGRTSHLRQISGKSFNFESMNRSPNASFKEDEGIHGTATASLLLEGLGTNSNLIEYVHLVALSEWGGSEFTLASAIYYGADLGCDVFSMSLGYYSSIESPIIDSAFLYAKAKGGVFIIAAGNGGEYVSYPANKYGDIIAGAVDRGSVRPIFSNRPKTEDEASRFVYAPGHQMALTFPRWYFSGIDIASGTSFATPLVSALVLNEMLHHPLTAQQAVEKVLLSAHSQGTEMESWIPYASNANRIPQISNISVEPGVVTNSGTIRVVAKVAGNITDPFLLNHESGREVSLAKMVSLGNGFYSGEMVVENQFQTRYKKLWIKAENEFGSYTAPTPSFLMIGNLIEDIPTIRFSGRPRIGRVITVGINWNGKYDYAFISASYGGSGINPTPIIQKIITENEPLSIRIDCGQVLNVYGHMVSGKLLYEVRDTLAFENTSGCPNLPKSFSIVSNPKMSLNTDHYVYAPSYIHGRIKWTITTDPLMPDFQSIEVYDGNALNLKDKLTNLRVDDKIYVHATALLPDTYYSNSEEIIVIPEELKIPTYYETSVPFVRN